MAATPPQQRSPYPGLRPFNREESDLFYGRDRCIKSMVETLQETRFLSVLGPSGSGKSSLVRSGLFLDLEAGRARKAGARWTFIDIRHPRQQPYRELARELLRYECEVREGVQDGMGGSGGCNAPQFNPPDHVLAERRKQLRKDPLALARWWKDNRPDERTNLLLLVDQFEELFGYGEARERNDVEAFVNMLLKCRENNDPAVYIVLTMRSEFLAGCTLFAGLSEQINKSLSLTPRMTRDECRQAITGPAVMADVTLEPLLVTTLLNDMNSLAQWQEESDAPAPAEGAEAAPQPEGFKQTDLIARRADQLPLMQHVLNWMWLAAAARRSSPDEPIVLKLDDYLAVGGLTGALSRHAGEVMARTGDQEATRWIREEAENGRAWQELVRDTEQEGSARAELLRGLELSDRRRWWATTRPHPGWTDRYDGKFAAVDSFMARSVTAEKRRKTVRYGGTGLLAALALVAVGTTFAAIQEGRAAEAAAAAADVERIAAERQVNSARVQVQAAGAEAASAEGKAREADRVRKEAEAAQARATAAAAEAGRAAAQAQAQAKAARGQAEAAGRQMAQSNQAMEVARRQSDELTLASLDLTNRMIIPELRRASSLSAPADAEARIEQAQEALAPLSRANPEAFATAAMALRLEQAEFARASLDTVALAKTIGDFQAAGTTAGLRPALAELSLAQAERFSATADMLRGAPDRAVAGLNRAQALLAAPGHADQDKEGEAAWRKLFKAMTHAELGEALLAQGRGAEAFQQAESCLGNISLETIRTVDGKLLEVRCLIIQASAISDEAERGETFELAAQNLLKLARQEPRSTDVDLLKLLLIRQYFSFPDEDGTVDISQDNMAALVDQVLGKMLSKTYWLDEDGLPTAETMYPMEAWLEAEIVTKFVAASVGMAPDKDAFGVLKPLLTRAWDRMRSLRLYMLSAPVSQDHQLRLHAAQLAQRQLETYVALPASAEWRAATSIFDYQDSLETATGGVQLIASEGAAEERARRALIDHAASIVRAAADRTSLTRYPEAQLFVAQTRSSIDAICGAEKGSGYGCAELNQLHGAFQAAVAREEQALTEKLAGRTRGSAAVEIWTDDRGVALGGFDPVTCLGGGDALTSEADSKATFTEICELRKGRYAYRHLWGGQVWLFESEANLAAFKAGPGAYVPQFGGRDTGQLVEASDVPLAGVDGSYFLGVADGKRYLFSGTINESGSPVSAIFELTREQLAAAIENGKLAVGERRR